MKTVSAEFAVVQKRPDTYPVYRVYYKRRYWTGAAYAWESSWTALSENEVDVVQPIVHQFDTQTLNEFKVSNVILQLKNFENDWNEWNSRGRFAADGGSSFGYEPYLMKFQIRAGFRNVNQITIPQGNRTPGIEELLTIFTGVASDWQQDAKSHIMKVTVEGLEKILANGDAEEVSTTVTLETIGTGDGETKEFFTDNSGVGKIVAVTVNSVSMTNGTDYSISNLNDIEECALIELAQPPAAGHLVKCTYAYWKKNQKLDVLITDLLTEAGISSYSIDEATLGSISNNISQSSKADFEDGSNTNIDTDTLPGSMIIDYDGSTQKTLWQDFNSGDLGSNSWAGSDTSIVGGQNAFTGYYDLASSRLETNSGSADLNNRWIYKTYGRNIAFGEWNFNVRKSTTNLNQCIGFYFLINSAVTYGYYLQLAGDSSQVTALYKIIDGVRYQLAESADYIGTTFVTIKIVRNIEGNIKIYFDGVLKFDETDNDVDYGDRFIVYDFVQSNWYIDDIYIPIASLTASHESQTLDTISGLSAWGNLSVAQESSSGVFDYKTRASSDGSSWDSWVAVSATNGIQSAVKRYIQVQINFTLSTATLPALEPKVDRYTVQFISDIVLVAMGNFAGRTCYDAIRELAKLVDFEWGFNDDEAFFFRSREVSATVDETFSQDVNISDIPYIKNGNDNVYSIIRAQFGNFVSEVVAASGSRTSPLEIYGRRAFSLSSSILIDQDTNFADALADAYFDRLSTKRRRLRISTKFWPQVELSDTVSVTFKHDPWAAHAQLLDGLVCKVIGTKHDPEAAMSEFELEEVV